VSGPAVQYRVVLGKKVPDLVDGPDDAALVISVALADAGLDPTVAYMQGRLKPTGDTGVLFDVLKSGDAAAALSALAARA
jgi:hypothetical protein